MSEMCTKAAFVSTALVERVKTRNAGAWRFALIIKRVQRFFFACFFNEVRQVVLPLSFDAGKQNRVYLEVSRCTSEPSNAIGIYLQSPEIMTYIHPPLMFSTVTCYESICERHEKREKTYYSLFLCYFGAVKSETPETKLLPATVGRIGENRNRCLLRVHLYSRTRMCSTRGSHRGVYAHHTCTRL